MVLGGRSYPLAGVQAPGRTSVAAAELARVDAALLGLFHGVQIRCTPLDASNFVCKTFEGRDIAEQYLLSGGAVLADGALSYYADAQRTAQEQQRGLWFK